MFQILLVVHVIITAAIIGLVLMQQGKGADAGAAFGSGASGTVFGSRGASNFLSKTTAILATLFFVSSLTLAWLAGNQDRPVDIMDSIGSQPAQELPSDMPDQVVDQVENVLEETDIPIMNEEKIPE